MKYVQASDMGVEMFSRQWGDTLSCSVCSTMSILLMVLFLALHGPLCSSWPNVSCGGWDCTRQSRDVIKAVKKRLSNRNPVVQLLTLTVSIPLLYLVVKHQVELWMLLPVLWLGQSKQNCEGPVHVHWLNGFDVNSMPIYMLEGDMPAKNR